MVLFACEEMKLLCYCSLPAQTVMLFLANKPEVHVGAPTKI